ncbi:histone-lysine N-methyltransferase SETMAR [Elysia marginata]|uniref:Histone-lysine N-methyltransferase SETMAR n=1 Tax=Elysia marginata TaxID=1093978 RepID=A0AAV4ETR5_9GAST|nr:histone-lysine N-methyltransferase SETMAR [Elysia marginata]
MEQACRRGKCIDSPSAKTSQVNDECLFGDDKNPWGSGKSCPAFLTEKGRQSCKRPNTLSMCCETCPKYATGWPDILDYRKVSARRVPRMLTNEVKMQRKTTCAELLKNEEEGEEFIQRIVTGDESWVHHYDPDIKRQSMEYRHKSSPSPRKFKVITSARKVMLTVF